MYKSNQYRQTNRWGSLVLTFLTMLFLPHMAYATADMSVTSVTGAPGSSVSVSVIADTSVSVNSIQFVLQYDQNLLNVSSVTLGSANASWVMTSNPNNITGKVSVAMFNTGGSALSVSGSQQQIAVINFTVNNPPGDPNTTSALTPSSVAFDTTTITQLTAGTFTLNVPPVYYTLTVNVSGNGSVTESVGGVTTSAISFLSGTVVQLTAAPGSGHQFSDWSVNGGPNVNTNPLNVTMNGNTTILADFSANAAPSFTTQPVSMTVTAPATATFTAAATGTPAPTYQWEVSLNGGASWSAINGATGPSYTTSATSTAMSGYKFECVASNGVAPAATSNAATLTVNPASVAPVITTQPVSVTVTAPATATFTAAATGTPAPTYQWEVSTNGGTSFTNISGATSATYTITSTTIALNGNEYKCLASNGVSPAATSNAATLTVQEAPVITVQPVSETVVAPGQASFSVTATSEPPPTFQWQISTDGGATFSNYGSSTTAVLTTASSTYFIGVTTANNGNEFRCVVTNGISPAATSNAAILTVNPAPVAPVFTTQPVSVTVSEPATATFTAAATGTPTPTYQWEVSTNGGSTWSAISGATGPSYTTSATNTAMSGYKYECVASNGVTPAALSNAVTLTVNTTTYIITANAGPNGSISPAGSVPVNYGANQTFTVTPDTNYNAALTVDGLPATLTNNTYTFSNVKTSHTIAVSFSLQTEKITATSGANGSISPSGTVLVNSGSSQIFTVKPNSAAYQAVLTVDGLPATLINNTYTFSDVTSSHTIAVSFILTPETISANAGPNGSISPSGAVIVNYGSSQTFNFIPNTGYSVNVVYVDGVSVKLSSPNSYTFSSVTSNHTIAVSFTPSYIITASAGTGGTMSPSGAVSVDVGASQKFTITPNKGYGINEVLVDNVAVTLAAGNTYTISDVTAAHTITASFVPSYTITASSGANGSITPSGAINVNSGASQTFTIKPNSAAFQAVLTVDGVPATLINNTYTFSDVTSPHTITVSFILTPETISANAGPNGSISPSGAVIVNYGSSQTFNFIPNTGYSVNVVYVDGSPVRLSSPNSYTLSSVTSNHTIAVSFTPSYIITASAGTGGTISPSGAVSVDVGASQKFTITPNKGYGINEVLVDNVAVTLAAGNTYTISNVTAAHTIRAIFIPSYTITASSGANGSITPSGAINVNSGASQTFTIKPNSAAFQAVLTVDGVPATLINNTYTFSDVTSPHTITVSFILTPETISANAGPNGSISPSGAVIVNYGSSQTFNFIPNTGYSVNVVYVDGSPVRLSSPNSYTLSSVTSNHTIAVSFTPSYIITASAGTGGTISPSGAVSVDVGASQKFTITPNKGYGINEVLVDNVAVTLAAGNTYTISNVTAAHTIRAIFIPSYTITASSGANGSITPSGAINVNSGASQTFTIKPNSAAFQAVLTVDGVPATLINNTYTFSDVTSPHTITVSFILTPETISANAGPNGSISPAGAVIVNYGSSKTFNFIPNTGYSVNVVYVDGSPVKLSSPNSYTFSNVTGNHTIAVSFTISYIITATAGSGGSISPSGAVSVDMGASQEFTISPDIGYGINEVLVDNVPVTLAAGNTYTISDVTAAHTISVSFVPCFAIIATSGPNGRISPSGIVLVNSGSSQTFTVTPNSATYMAVLTVDGLPATLTNNTYTFTDVTSAHVITVDFVLTGVKK